MVGAAGFEPATPRPPGERQATSGDTSATNTPDRIARTSVGEHEGPGGDARVGQVAKQQATPREALAAALGEAIGRAVTAGDMHAAGVAYEALGRLMEEPDSSAPEAVPIEPLIVARRRDKLGRP